MLTPAVPEDFILIQAVLFDYDGVLLDSMPYHVRAWQHAFAEYDVQLDPEEVLLAEGSPAPELAREIFSSRNIAVTAEEIQNLVVKKQTFYREITAARLLEGVEALLFKLDDAGMRLALVTGSERENVDKTLPASIAHLFDVVVTGDDVQNGKPAPDPYLKAAEKLELDPKSCLVIENAPYGIASAQRAGMIVAAVTTTLKREQLPDADVTAENLRDLSARLDEIIPKKETTEV